jgi:hypothetical protein
VKISLPPSAEERERLCQIEPGICAAQVLGIEALLEGLVDWRQASRFDRSKSPRRTVGLWALRNYLAAGKALAIAHLVTAFNDFDKQWTVSQTLAIIAGRAA